MTTRAGRQRAVLLAMGALLCLPSGVGGIPQPSPAGDLGLQRERGPRFLSSGLEIRAREAPGARTLAWVFFTDKGIRTREGYAQALGAVRSRLGPEARRRREALGPDLGLDFHDLPVHEPYVAALRRAGFHVRRVSRWMNAASVQAPAGRLPELGALDFVREVHPLLVKRREKADALGPRWRLDALGNPEAPSFEPWSPLSTEPSSTTACVVPAPDSVEAAFYGPSFNQLGQIGVLDLHRLGYSGAGVRVMVLDTGFLKTHPAFAHVHWVAEWDFVNEDGDTGPQAGDASNQHYHGTGVWGAAGGYDPGALIGPAFAAEWVLAKTEDVVNEVHAEEDNYVAALEWADDLGVDVTTASLAYFTFDDSTGYTQADLDGDTAVISQAVDIAVSKGIACANAAGNEGPEPTSVWTPADAESVIAVGAVDSCGTLQGFSSRGPTADLRVKPDICARGRSTYWARAWTGGYGPASGTSLSTPLIGGLAALLKEAHPNWTGASIRTALMNTGTHAVAPDNDLGFGIAQGVLALNYGGGPVSPPRMTLPFRLVAPDPGEVVWDVRPTLTWTPSVGANPGEVAQYRVLMAADPAFASEETVYEGPNTSFTFALAIPTGETRWWRVEAIGDAGYARRSLDERSFTVSSALVAEPPSLLPGRYRVGPAYPNPMHSRTSFEVEAPLGETVTVEVLSISGRVVSRMAVTGGDAPRRVLWDRTDTRGARLPAGLYVVRLAQAPAAPGQKLLALP